MPKVPPLVRIGFTEGTKSTFDPSSVPPNALWDALNIRGDESGILRVRTGSKSLHTSLGPGYMQAFGSAFGKIIGVWNRLLYTFQAGSSTPLGAQTVSTAASGRVKMINWTRSGAEILYLLGGDGLYQSTGGAPTLVDPYAPQTGEKTNLLRKADGGQDTASGPARCVFGVLRASLSQRLAVAGNPVSPNTVYLSEALDATYFRSDQIIQLPDDGGKITGLANWYNALIIFRDRDIWAFFGSSVTDPGASLVLQDASAGSVNGDTIAVVPSVGLVFLGKDNVYTLQGVAGVENQVKAIPLVTDALKHFKIATSYGTDRACAVFFDNEYRLFFPDCPEPRRVFRYHLLNTPIGWYMDSGPLCSKVAVVDKKLYGAAAGEGRVVEFTDSLLDDNQPIESELFFRREDLQPGPARIKKIYIYVLSKGRAQKKDLFFLGGAFNEEMFGEEEIESATFMTGSTQHLNVTAIVDGMEFTAKDFLIYVERVSHVSLTRAEPLRVYEARFNPSLKGNFIQIRITANTREEDIAVVGYGIEYANREKIHGRKAGVTV